MAHVKSIWFHDQQFRSGNMRVIVALRPTGELTVNVPLPEDLHITIMKLAQTAADAHEAQMRAEILGEKYVGIDVPQAHPPQAPAEEADSTKEATVTHVQFDNQGMPEYIFTKDAVYKISAAQEVEQPKDI